MDDLHETLDEVREAEELPHRGLRLLVTTLILAVTVLGVVSAFLAARSDSRAVHTQTSQERESVTAQEVLAQASAFGSLVSDEQHLAALDLSQSITTATDPEVSHTWLQRSDQLTTNADSDAQRAGAAMTSSTDDNERSLIDGRVTRAARSTQNADTATAGMLAIALFLLGLILAVHLNLVRIVFLVGALVIGSAGAIRLLHNAEQRPPTVAASALASYERGLELAHDGDCARAVPDFREAAGDPGLPEAWLPLAECLDQTSSTDQTVSTDQAVALREAVGAYRSVVADNPADPISWNNIASDEMKYGAFDQAARDLAPALRDSTDVDYPYALGTAAELAALRGDAPGADLMATKAIQAVQQRTQTYRQGYFDVLRDDAADFVRTAYWNPVVAALYQRFRSAEASEDALGTSTPGVASGFTLTGLTAQFQALTAVTHPVGKLTVAVSGHAVASGVLSYRVYAVQNGSFQFEPELSLVQVAWPTSKQSVEEVEPVPATVPSGPLEVEVYWNGNLVTSKVVAVS